MRLLIADRDSTERTGIQWLLSTYSMRFKDIHQSPDIKSLLNELEEFKPDILLLELEMIPFSIWDSFIHVVEKNSVTIIAITAEAIFERAWQAIQLHAQDLLLKPLVPERIRQVLQMATNKRKGEIEKVAKEDEIEAHNKYASLFMEEKEASLKSLGMIIVQPEDKKGIGEISKWLEHYPFVNQPYILPLREHIVCLMPFYTNEMIFQEAQHLLKEAPEVNKLLIAVSPITSSTINTCYEQALQALKMVFFKGYQQIIDMEVVPVFKDIDPFLTPAEQREWILMLEDGDRDAIKRWLYEQFTKFPEGYPDPDLIRIRLTSILAQLRRFMQTYQLEKIQQIENRYQEIFQTILHVPLLFRIVQEVLLFIYDIVQEAVNQKKNSHSDFIERGLQYIDKNFHRHDLSLEEVANFVERSPSYFSHILSKRRAQTFRQYITEVRMKHAKHFLSGTQLTVREIAFAVGYEDPNYFSRIFKDTIGCSPRSWRNTSL